MSEPKPPYDRSDVDETAWWNPIPQQTAGPTTALHDQYGASFDQPSRFGPPAPFEQAGPVTGWTAPPQLSGLPDGERTYPQMLRGPRRRWWKPILSLLLAVAIALAAQLLAFGPLVLFGLVAHGPDGLGEWLLSSMDDLAAGRVDAAGFLYTNLGLIALIPAAGLSIWAVHQVRPRFVSSVLGGIRWRWLLRCVVVVLPVWILYTVASVIFDRPAIDRPAEWVVLLVIVLLTTPLQAAGEEYFFRGWILQNVGSWFRRPIVSLVAGTVVSAAAFSAAHGSPDPWIIGSLAIFAISCCVLTWRTGGLESAIVIHAVNNVSVFFAVINFGGWDEAFIGGDTKGDPAQFGIDAAVQVIAFALIWWQARRAKIVSTYRPVPGSSLTAVPVPAPVLPGPAG